MTLRRRGRPRPHTSHRYTQRLLRAHLELYQLLRTPRPLDSLLQAILDTALACVPGAQRGSLQVLAGERLHYRAARGYNLEALRSVSFPLSMVQPRFQSSRVAQISDYVSWDAEFLDAASNAILREHGHIEQIRRSMVTSIHVGGRLYGTLVLDNLRSHSPYPPEAETMARLFAEQAGTLLEHALLLDQLRQTSTMLIESEKLAALGRFIANIAHEINNPLTAVLGYTEFLAAADLDAEAQVLLDQLRLGAERVRAIVHSLQLFARQQRSGQGQVSLNLLAEQALTLKRGDLILDQIEVRLQLDPELPFTWADGGQLSQVLLNLIVNAQHALRQVAPPRLLSVQTALRDGEGFPTLTLLVVDNGAGIAPELSERIFEPFFTTRPAGQGTGLGLSICQSIVQAHGGTIRAGTAQSGGASFLVELPLRIGPWPANQAAPPAARPRPYGASVLLVEDDPSVVDVVLRALANANQVVVASQGVEALRLAAERDFDLLLCDLRMPEMGGLELYDRLAVAHPALAGRVLFISGDTNSPTTRTALAATGRPLLAKPFTPDELYAAMAEITLRVSYANGAGGA